MKQTQIIRPRARGLGLALALAVTFALGGSGAPAAADTAGQATVYTNLANGDCAGAPAGQGTPMGTVTAIAQADGTMHVTLEFTSGLANTTYSIANTCIAGLPYTISTDGSGAGSVTFALPYQSVLVLDGYAPGSPASGPGYFESAPVNVPQYVAPPAPVVPVASDKDECKNGGWQDVSRADGSAFKNQGDCVSYVATKS